MAGIKCISNSELENVRLDIEHGNIKYLENGSVVTGCGFVISRKTKDYPTVDTSLLNDFFERIWEEYPIKKGKGSVSHAKKIALYKIGYDEIHRCIERYKLECKGRENKYIKHGDTFFTSGYIDYLDKNYSHSNYGPDSPEVKIADYFLKFLKGYDSKYEYSNPYCIYEKFTKLIDAGREPKEICIVIRSLFASKSAYMIRKYGNTDSFCNCFDEIGRQLMIMQKENKYGHK